MTEKTLGSAADRKTGLALPCNFVPYDIRPCTGSGEMIPREVLSFVGAQLGVPADALLTYATRRQTRQQHMDTLREIYGYKTFTGRGARDLREWTFGQAEDARSNEDLAHRFIVRCRETSTILPAVSTIERLCADALVAAERRIETRIAENLTADVRDHLDKLLSEMLAGNISRFIWLRNFEVGNNSAAANRLLDRLEFLRTLNINHSALASIPALPIALPGCVGRVNATSPTTVCVTSLRTAAGRSLPSVLWSGKRRLLMP